MPEAAKVIVLVLGELAMLFAVVATATTGFMCPTIGDRICKALAVLFLIACMVCLPIAIALAPVSDKSTDSASPQIPEQSRGAESGS